MLSHAPYESQERPHVLGVPRCRPREDVFNFRAVGFDPAVYDSVLTHLANEGRALYQAAYIMPAPPLGYDKNHSNHLRLIQIMMRLRVYDKLKRMQHLKDAHGYLILYPSMGEFTTMQ